jgi:hypothetical protein
MRDSKGENYIVTKVMKEIGPRKRSGFLDFVNFSKLNPKQDDCMQFLTFLDSSRVLISERHPEGSLPLLHWIPTPDITDVDSNHAISRPSLESLWKTPNEAYRLTAVVTAGEYRFLLTESQALKYEFLQFASQLLEAKYYKVGEDEEVCVPSVSFFESLIFSQPSIDLVALWFHSNLELFYDDRNSQKFDHSVYKVCILVLLSKHSQMHLSFFFCMYVNLFYVSP